jgi:ankyrin repeat protein
MGEDKSRKQTEQAAMAEAKKKAVESVSTHVRSETEVKDFQLEKDLVSAYANAEVKVIQELEKGWYKDPSLGDCYRIRIKAEVFPDVKFLEPRTGKPGAGQERAELERMGIEYKAENFLKAVADNNIKVSELFLEAGIDVNVKTEKDGNSALILALENKKSPLAKMIIDAGANPSAENNSGYFPLLAAARYGLCDTVTRLIAAKAELGDKGSWALESATASGYLECARALLEAGVTPDSWNARDGLGQAAAAGHVEMVKLFMEKGFDVLATDKQGKRIIDRLFIRAVHAGKIEMLRFLLAKGADRNSRDGDGNSALMLCIKKKGREDAFRLLLGQGADVTGANKNNETALHLAVENEKIDFVKLLLEAKADPSVMDRFGRTPVISAIDRSSAEMLKLLISHGADINARGRDGRTALMLAVKDNKPELVKLLVQAKADPGIADEYGSTPVLEAVQQGSNELTRFLVTGKTAGLDAIDREGRGPVMLAVERKAPELLKTLLEAGADCSQAAKDGYTPVMRAASADWTEGVTLLAKSGANMNGVSKQGDSALMWALKREKWRMAAVLIESKADPSLPDRNGTTPLMWVAGATGGEDLIRQLADRGAKMNAANSDGETALFIAIKKKNYQAIKSLISAKADVNAVNGNGETALHLAVKKNDLEAARTLIEANADARKPDNRGYSPLDMAKAQKKAGLVEMLEKR